MKEKQLSIIPRQVFISYAKEDVKKAKSLYKMLFENNIRAWIDIEELDPGENWDAGIRQAIRDCQYVIVLLSNNSITKKGYVQKEIKEALDIADTFPENEIFILPVRLEACRVPERFNKWQWSDFFDQQGKQKLISFLKAKLGISNYPLLKEHERELRSTLSTELIAETILLKKFSTSHKIIRSKNNSGKLFISDYNCVEIRNRSIKFIQLYDQLFPTCEKWPPTNFTNILDSCSQCCRFENSIIETDLTFLKKEHIIALKSRKNAQCGIHSDYFTYMILKYPMGTYYMYDDQSPVVVKDSDEIRFLVMPCRMD